MRKVLIVFLLAAVMTAGGCSLAVPTQKYEALQTERDSLQEQVTQLQSQVSQLEADKKALEESLAERRENEPTDPFDEKILGSMFLRPDLIPVGGESMRYYTDLCRVLGERYVYAYAEDGRSTADMILSYEMGEDGAYVWALEAYDDGHGWRVPAGDGGMDAAGAIPEPVETPEPASSAPSEESQAGEEDSTPPTPPTAQTTPPASSSTAPGTPVPNEAQQQKFRDIASLIE